MARLAGSVSKSTAVKTELAEKEIIIPLILKIFAQPLNGRIAFKLSIFREQRLKYGVGARVLFNDYFSISRHGRNSKTGETWPTKVTMNLVQLWKAQELLRKYGYDMDRIYINTEVLGKPLLECEIDADRIEKGLN